MSIGSIIKSYKATTSGATIVILLFLVRIFRDELIVKILGESFWKWVDANMLAVTIITFLFLLMVFSFDKVAQYKQVINAAKNPMPDIIVIDAAKYIQKKKRSWRKHDEQKIIIYLFTVVANGNLTAWGANEVYGSGRVLSPTLLTLEFFHEWAGSADGESNYHIRSLSLNGNKWHHNIYFNKKELEEIIKDLPKVMPTILEKIEHPH